MDHQIPSKYAENYLKSGIFSAFSSETNVQGILGLELATGDQPCAGNPHPDGNISVNVGFTSSGPTPLQTAD